MHPYSNASFRIVEWMQNCETSEKKSAADYDVAAFSVVALKVLNISVATGLCQFKVAYLNDPNYTFFRSFLFIKI